MFIDFYVKSIGGFDFYVKSIGGVCHPQSRCHSVHLRARLVGAQGRDDLFKSFDLFVLG